VIFVPVPGYRDDKTGAYTEPAELDADDWRTLISSVDEIGRQIAADYGVRLEFHPHADSHVETQAQVEQFLADTNPDYVSLCLDTGHLAYTRADNVAIIKKFPSRIGYVHIKQMDPAIVAKPRQRTWPSGRPWRWARAASRPTACPTSRRSSMPWPNSTPSCS
jgi:inosose dehydratase